MNQPCSKKKKNAISCTFWSVYGTCFKLNGVPVDLCAGTSLYRSGSRPG